MVDEASAVSPARRVVVLGASNVTLGFSTVVETARHAWGQPIEMLGAIGHGRSYGLKTTVFGRGLPGIVQCGLWQELKNRPHLPTAALITDIGNDIIYGCNVGPILTWLETCLERLAERTDRLVITRLPIATISAFPEWKTRLLVSLFFPNSRLKHDEALSKAQELDQRLLDYANRYDAYVVQPETCWYTWDPIHIARRHRPRAWQALMSWWLNGQLPAQATHSIRRWLELRQARPLRWTCFGVERHCTQPSVKFNDGTTISLF